MKFGTLICLICVLSGHCLVLKRPRCGFVPAANGNCNDSSPSWTYFPKENLCKPFVYSGCGGNANRFAAEYQCENKCKNNF